MPNVLIVPVGARCSGKSYWTEKAIDKFTGLRIIKSNTTRPMRKPPHDEIDKCSYYFWSEAEFDAEIAAERLVQTGEHSGFRYGLHIPYIERELSVGSGVIPLIPTAAEMIYEKLTPRFEVRIIVFKPTSHLLMLNLHRRNIEDKKYSAIKEDADLHDFVWRVPVKTFELNGTPIDEKILDLFDPSCELSSVEESK
jgi:guanylate kinase